MRHNFYSTVVSIFGLLLALFTSAALAQSAVPLPEAFARVARQTFELRPTPKRIGIAPFQAIRGGLGDCDIEFRDQLIASFKREQADPTNLIVDRAIDIWLIEADANTAASDVKVEGRYGGEISQLWVEAQVVKSDGTVLALLPRTRVSDHICKGGLSKLADTVENIVRSTRDSGLSIQILRAAPQIGDAVGFTMQSKLASERNLLCLNVSSVDTADVVTPLRDKSPTLGSRRNLHWPSDFRAVGLPTTPICYDREQSDTFVCFALPSPLTSRLTTLWREAWPDGLASPRELDAHSALAIVSEASRTADGAAVVRYSVSRGDQNLGSACNR